VKIITVPDFAGPNLLAFELRTLFFLASWIECREILSEWPVHLACIGQPPDSVAALAETAGASISIHEPLPLLKGGHSNKLRGLEAAGGDSGILLLDVDMLLTGSLEPLRHLDGTLCAARAPKPRVPEQLWPRIYESLGMRPPESRITSFFGEINRFPPFLDLYPEQRSECRAMFPYFNSGALLVPAGCRLLDQWRDHLERLAEFAENIEEPYRSSRELTSSDQTALATALEQLRRDGLPFKMLPDMYNVFDVHLIYGKVPMEQARILHVARLFRRLDDRPGAVSSGLSDWLRITLKRSLQCLAWYPRPTAVWRLALASPRMARDHATLHALVERLLARHVSAALRLAGKGRLL
jgi:hypothetical protein